MTPEPTKEALEKADEVLIKWLNTHSDSHIELVKILALEFTNYQKRVEELEKHLQTIKARNLINALKAICPTCGHTNTELRILY
jgi:endonuclease IV